MYYMNMYMYLSILCLQKSGATVVSDPERDKTMVQELLELKNKVDKIITNSFEDQEKFHDAVRVS